MSLKIHNKNQYKFPATKPFQRHMPPPQEGTRGDDLAVEKDLWWTALVILLTTGEAPVPKKSRIKRCDLFK